MKLVHIPAGEDGKRRLGHGGLVAGRGPGGLRGTGGTRPHEMSREFTPRLHLKKARTADNRLTPGKGQRAGDLFAGRRFWCRHCRYRLRGRKRGQTVPGVAAVEQAAREGPGQGWHGVPSYVQAHGHAPVDIRPHPVGNPGIGNVLLAARALQARHPNLASPALSDS